MTEAAPSAGARRTHLFEYEYEGDAYGLQVAACSQAEAVGRVRRMSTAIYKGELIATIPARLGWLGRAAVLLRNAIR